MTDKTRSLTALDALLARVPGIDPKVLETTKQAVKLLTGLGLLSTEPAEVFRPFNRGAVLEGTGRSRTIEQPGGIQLSKK